MNPEIMGALIGAGVLVLLSLGHALYTAGSLKEQLRGLQKTIDEYKETFRGLHRRLSDQDAALDGIRGDLTAIRTELELNPQVRLRPKTNA